MKHQKPVAPSVKEIQTALQDVSRNTGNRLWEVFRDWIECCAVAISNSVDFGQAEAREAVYMKHVARYGKESMHAFARALAVLIQSMDDDYADFLGQLFMGLDFGEASMGQFFTPYDISRLMAGLTLTPDEMKEKVAAHGFIRFNEPACGSGGMVVAFVEAMRNAGLNPQKQLHVVAQDLDLTAVHMAYVQLSMLGVPAVVIHGNTLSLETRSTWYTPFHVLHGWERKLAQHEEVEPVTEPKTEAQTEQVALL